MLRTWGVLVVSLFLVVGCSEDDSDPVEPDADVVPDDPDAAAPDEWQSLIEGEWTRAAGSEGYTCVYKTLEETIWVSGFEPISPLGTHHTVVSIGNPVRADGIYPCGANTNQSVFLGGSGVGTNIFELPEGVGVKLEAGQQLLLNLHLFNFSESELTGVSGMNVKAIAEEDVVFEGETFIMGAFGFTIPPGEFTQSGQCTMQGDTTLISVFPHMHMLGTHMKIEAQSSVMGDMMLRDEPYNFDEQIIYAVQPGVEMMAGDTITVDCTWNNTTGVDVGFGDSSLEEMCFVGLFRYPPAGGTFCFN